MTSRVTMHVPATSPKQWPEPDCPGLSLGVTAFTLRDPRRVFQPLSLRFRIFEMEIVTVPASCLLGGLNELC